MTTHPSQKCWLRACKCSVKPLQYHCVCLPVSVMLPMRKLLFCYKKMLRIENELLCLLAKCCKGNISAVTGKFHIRSNNVLITLVW